MADNRIHVEFFLIAKTTKPIFKIIFQEQKYRYCIRPIYIIAKGNAIHSYL